MWRTPLNRRHRILRCGEERIEMLQQPWPDCPCRIVFLVLKLDGYDDVRIDGPERHAQIVADLLPPAFRLPQRVLVTDDDRGAHLIDKGQQTMVRIALQDETDAATTETGGDIGQALNEKAIVPAVSTLDERVQAEEGHDRQPEFVAEAYGDVERRVVHRTLRALHPVDDAVAVRIRLTCGANGDARVLAQRHAHVSYTGWRTSNLTRSFRRAAPPGPPRREPLRGIDSASILSTGSRDACARSVQR